MNSEEETEKTSSDQQTKKGCRSCGSEIPANASLCFHCHSLQSRPRSFLLFIAQVAGALSLFAAAVTFVAGNYDQWRKTFFWRENIELQYFSALPDVEHEYVIANRGDGEVFIAKVVAYYRHGNYSISVNEPLKPNSFLASGDLGGDNAESWDELDASYLTTADGSVPEVIKHGSEVSIMDDSANDACYGIHWFDSNAFDIQRMNRHYKQYDESLALDSATLEVEYFTGGDAISRISVRKGVVAFIKRSTCD